MIPSDEDSRPLGTLAVPTAARDCVLDAARSYVAHGISVVPCRREGAEKRPLVKWSDYAKRLPRAEELTAWFADGASAIGIVCGQVSGNIEVIDFDCRGEDFARWRAMVNELAPGLVERLVIQRTPSGGVHVVYRSESAVPRSSKLARRRIVSDQPFVEAFGKRVATKPDRYGSRTAAITSIETRGEGGLALCSPSDGYALVQGSLTQLPVVSAEDRGVLISTAKRFDEVGSVVAKPAPPGPDGRGPDALIDRPGDDYNRNGDVRALLTGAGWTFLGAADDGNERWCRPGKEGSVSATLNGSHLYVFSSNAPPFEEGTSYTPFAVYALLRHGGDYAAASAELARSGYGSDRAPGLDGPRAAPTHRARVPLLSAAELANSEPALRPVIVHGLLRSGEVMNLVAPPKIGKSWLALWLAMSVACGREWLSGFAAVTHRVLLVDNELHVETIAERMRALSAVKEVDLEEVGERLKVLCLRGEACDIDPLHEIEAAAYSAGPGLVVIDALYRALPVGTDENDNAAVTAVYSRLVRLAARTGAAVVVVHHTSKGDQRFRAVTDVGAGAGAQSRACDSHVILRPGNRVGGAIMDMALRSFESRVGIGLRFDCPVWTLDSTVRPRQPLEERVTAVGESWSAERFAREVVGRSARTRADIESIRPAGVSKRAVGRLLDDGVEKGCIARSHPKRCVPATFASILPPE